MQRSLPPRGRPTAWRRSGCATIALGLGLCALSGCTVVAITASAVGLAASVAVGTVKVVGKGVGMAADALVGEDKPDHSGIQIRESIRPAPAGAMPH